MPASIAFGEHALSDLIGNEKLKLTATWLNGISVAIFAAGVVLPVVNQLIGLVKMEAAVLAILAGICMVAAVGIHWGGQALLGGLDDTDV